MGDNDNSEKAPPVAANVVNSNIEEGTVTPDAEKIDVDAMVFTSSCEFLPGEYPSQVEPLGKSPPRGKMRLLRQSSPIPPTVYGIRSPKVTQQISPSVSEISVTDDENGNKPETDCNDVPPYNVRALTKHDTTYKLETFDKNLLVIFNQENIRGKPNPRTGTAWDVAALEKTFEQFGFETRCHTDFTRKEILDELDNFSKIDFTDYGCLAVAVLSHGDRGGWIMAEDELYSEHDILDRLKTRNAPILITKPLIVIIQACRGVINTKGVPVHQEEVPSDHHDETIHYHLPLEADIIVIHSSFPGKRSWRPEGGSWFIQTLCKKINEKASTDHLESILIDVKRDIAIKRKTYYNSDDKERFKGQNIHVEVGIQKQIPVVTSALIRKLYLRKKSETSSDIPTDSTTDTPTECSCFLEHFKYLKKCLSQFVNEQPYNVDARDLLSTINSQTGNEKGMLVALSCYLQTVTHSHDCHKYMHFMELNK